MVRNGKTNHKLKNAPSKTRRHWRTRSKICLLLGSLAASLLVAELGVRLFGQAPSVIRIGIQSDKNVYQRSANPLLSYEFKPGFTSDDDNLAFEYRRINKHGLRDIEREYAKPKGVKRIILLGDSVVAGYGVKGIDQLMSRQMEMLYADENVEVLNMAVTGYCTLSEVELLRVKGLAYQPDAVILVFVENDFRNFNPESIGADGIVNRPAFINALFSRSHLFRLACLTFNWFSFGLEADPSRWNQKAIGDNNVTEGLKLFRQLADANGFRPLVAVWPTFGYEEIEYADNMFMPGSEALIIEKLAASLDLPIVGLREPFIEHWRQHAPQVKPRLHYTIDDEMHASVEGHKAAAEILHHLIGKHELLIPTSEHSNRKGNSLTGQEAVAAAKALGKEKASYGLYYINRAVTLVQGNKYAEAARELSKVSETDTNNFADARTMLASIQRHQGNIAAAKENLTMALKYDQNHLQARLDIADLLMAEQSGMADLSKAREQAIAHLKYAAEQNSHDFRARHRLGKALAAHGQLQHAQSHLAAAQKLNPRSVTNARQLARVYAAQGNHRSAVEMYKRVMTIDATRGQDFVELGRSLNKLQQFEDARAVFRRGLVTAPDNADLHFLLGLLYVRSNDLQRAHTHLNRAVELAPKSTNSRNALGYVLIRLGRNSEARRQFQHSLEINPNDTTAKRNLDSLQRIDKP